MATKIGQMIDHAKADLQQVQQLYSKNGQQITQLQQQIVQLQQQQRQLESQADQLASRVNTLTELQAAGDVAFQEVADSAVVAPKAAEVAKSEDVSASEVVTKAPEEE